MHHFNGVSIGHLAGGAPMLSLGGGDPGSLCWCDKYLRDLEDLDDCKIIDRREGTNEQGGLAGSGAPRI
jgi:hypothetical protein